MIRTLIAVSSPDYFRGMTVSVHKVNGMTFLHAIVRDNPPLDIVGNTIKLCPEMVAARDGLGRTPLHIAAGSKVSSLLLKLIARAYPAACDAQDEDGRTPLHFVCDTSFILFSDNDPSQKASQHEAVVALLSESSHASTIEDADEMSPLEHAIMCGASLKTVQLLQASATKSLPSRARSATASPNPGPGANKRRKEYQAHTKMYTSMIMMQLNIYIY
mmetsp:Transcript_33345/g.50167  ORF Transcript_33345/g.50167 Transcript_33345/m.50167 type:complete len:217 (-) Transcript_33345:675-1325(-)